MVSLENIVTEQGCGALMRDAKVLGPVGGVFHLAMVSRYFMGLDDLLYVIEYNMIVYE